jgi:prepilin-type N-terminal cleavage/methylation domain-containing protein
MLYITQNQKGLTLVEVLVSITILVLISMLLANYITNSYKTQKFIINQTDTTEQARKGVEAMVKEIREVVNGGDGSYPIVTIDDNEIIFFADFDRDMAIERIHYWLQDSTLYKGVTEPAGDPIEYSTNSEIVSIVCSYVRNESSEPIFSYKDGLYQDISLPSNPNNVRLIHFSFKINTSSEESPNDYLLESDVTIRNFKKDV